MTFPPLLLLFLGDDFSSPDSTRPPGGDETDLPTGAGASLHGGGFANMLMVTTTVGMLYGVHGNTTNLRPAVPLRLVLVVSTASLQHRLVDPSSSSHNTDHGSVGAGDNLLGAGGKLDPGPLGVGVVSDHSGVVAAGPGHLAAISSLLLEVADDSSLGHEAYGHHVTDGDLSLPSAVDELAGVHALGRDEQLLLDLVPVGVPEVDDGQGGSTAGVVDDVLDDSLDVSVTLGEVGGTESGLTLAVLGVGGKHGPGALPLGADYTTHVLSSLVEVNQAILAWS